MSSSRKINKQFFTPWVKCNFSPLLIFVLIIIEFNIGLAQAYDHNLTPTNSSFGYSDRGNRYEGFYVAEVSIPSLEIVGVTEGKFDYKFDVREKLTISSPLVRGKSVNVRAVGIPLKTYYRMDALLSPNRNLEWAVGDVLYPQNLDDKKIGVYGWIDSLKSKIYVPLKVKSNMLHPPEDTTVYVYLRASIDVMKVRWRFADISEDGNCGKSGKWVYSKKAKYKSGDRIVCKITANRNSVVCFTLRANSQDGDEELSCEAKIILK